MNQPSRTDEGGGRWTYWSQEELAFRVGVHRTYLGGIERGERNPSLRNLAAIANGLWTSLSELFSF